MAAKLKMAPWIHDNFQAAISRHWDIFDPIQHGSFWLDVCRNTGISWSETTIEGCFHSFGQCSMEAASHCQALA
ncbi:hypothetical protein [Synechococcus sp. MIT S9507]